MHIVNASLAYLYTSFGNRLMFDWCFLFVGEESVNMGTAIKPALQPTNDKILFVDRLAISITKRKRSTPQKFLGEFFLSEVEVEIY